VTRARSALGTRDPDWPPKRQSTPGTGYNCDRPHQALDMGTSPTGAAAGAHSHRVNVRWSIAASEDGTVKSDDELRAVYTGAGLDEGESTSRTAASASVPVISGSCCRNCWGCAASKTTMVPGPSTVHWSAYRSSWAARLIVMCGAPEQTQQVLPGRDLRKHTVVTGTVRTAGPRRWCLRAATRRHWGVHRRGGVLSLRPVPLLRRPPASGPSVDCTDPASARPSSLPPVQACFRSTLRCRKRIQRAESGNVGGEGQRRGLRAKVYVWFEHFEGKGCVEGARSL
jgi:hypothetical protein